MHAHSRAGYGEQSINSTEMKMKVKLTCRASTCEMYKFHNLGGLQSGLHPVDTFVDMRCDVRRSNQMGNMDARGGSSHYLAYAKFVNVGFLLLHL